MRGKPALMVAYSLFVFFVETYFGIGNWKVVSLYMTTRRVGQDPCVAFYCVTSTWILAVGFLIIPLILGYFILRRYGLKEHAGSHLLFGLLLLPVGICKKLYGEGFVMMLIFLFLATGLLYLLQRDYYEKRIDELALVVFTWFVTTSALMVKPWAC
ncbi:hypothetical protein [Thermococcus alcaliphilus]|uniref:hypothetical protein n=1 Tax=Thermococcus alcaliphilus TaxID=139207 RepID=UPI002090DFEE|nr:hypothetical protein [Thermococcus alcaliphilus]MCO6040821.1 hypothetical protein [Thermococcus alcaliphilus]